MKTSSDVTFTNVIEPFKLNRLNVAHKKSDFWEVHHSHTMRQGEFFLILTPDKFQY